MQKTVEKAILNNPAPSQKAMVSSANKSARESRIQMAMYWYAMTRSEAEKAVDEGVY